MFARVTWWFGAIALCFGRRAFHVLLFPLLFLLWGVPWPEIVVSRVTIALQQSSVFLTYLLFEFVGVPVAKDEVVLTIPADNRGC
jgi:hypothetical protein